MTKRPWTSGEWKAFRKPMYYYEDNTVIRHCPDPDRWILRSKIKHAEGDPITHTTIYLGEIVRCGNMSDAELEANARIWEAAPAMAEALQAYAQWEADLIMSSQAWEPNGMAITPTIPQELWDRLIEIQGMRNAALKAARGETP